MVDAASNPPALPGASLSALEAVTRPLLELVQWITRMETSFITDIDWDEQRQDVLFSLNTGEMRIPEGATTEWKDSMCRAMFLAGRAASDQVGADVPATCNAVAAQMQSFVAVPIMVGDQPIGTVCASSQRKVRLDDGQVDALRRIADALQYLLHAEHERTQALRRAAQAEEQARQARETACQQAIDFHRMARLAHTDELTGLPNRRAFVARMEEALARSARRQQPIGLLLIDADRFKTINDTLGHLVGDEVLGAIGAALRQTARSHDLVARLGGDEFAMVMQDATRAELNAIADTLRQRFGVLVEGLGVDATLSIGIAHSDRSRREQLLADADAALYRCKSAGGNCAMVHAPGEGWQEIDRSIA